MKYFDFSTVEGRQRFYQSKQWRQTRLYQLEKSPTCELCKQNGKIVAATIADHIQPLKERPDLALDINNLQSLCTSCHAAKSRSEAIFTNPKNTAILNQKWEYPF